MSGTIWIPGAERLHVSAPGGDITSTADPRVVWHTTEAPSGDPHQWQNMQNVLTSKGDEPQVLYDPLTDRLGQFMPLDVSGRALKNDGTTKTNRVGRVCIQIEVIAYAAKPFTDYWRPGPNFRALMAAIRSWGIPDIWPAGPPPRYVNGQGNVPPSPRNRATWLTKGGHYSHAQIPGNIHGDPGGISTTKLFTAGRSTTPGATPPATKPTPTLPEVLDMQLDDVVIAATPATATAPARPAITVRTVLSEAHWLAQQFSQSGQFEGQLDRIEAKLPKA